MIDNSARALKQVLVDQYGGFADKRIKNLDTGSFFHVDDRSQGDYDARKQLFLWFCQVTLTVKSGTTVEVALSGEVPMNATVKVWLETHTTKDRYDRPVIVIHKGEQAKLLDLAGAIGAIVAPGKRYPVKAYKYTCPRTAHSLQRLKATLDKAWA